MFGNIHKLVNFANNITTMRILKKIFYFYRDGFREMTVGRQLWLIIAIKVIIMFAVLKLFFFPDVVKEKTPIGGEESATVRQEVLRRGM